MNIMKDISYFCHLLLNRVNVVELFAAHKKLINVNLSTERSIVNKIVESCPFLTFTLMYVHYIISCLYFMIMTNVVCGSFD